MHILKSLYLLLNDSKIVAIKGGKAKGKYPMGSGNILFEKKAKRIILIPVASAIWICGDLKKSFMVDILHPRLVINPDTQNYNFCHNKSN